MTCWNYRVIKKKLKDSNSYAIHEVYYDDGNRIESWTEEPVCPFGESRAELRNDVFYFMQAFRLPVLNLVQENSKEKLEEEKEEEEAVTAGHYFEVMDRAAVVMAHFDDFVATHPVVRKNAHLRKTAQRITGSLYGFYSETANLYFDRKKGGKKGSDKIRKKRPRR